MANPTETQDNLEIMISILEIPTISGKFRTEQYLNLGNSGELICKTNPVHPPVRGYIWTKDGEEISIGP